jgi:hypothetical protein
VVVYTSPFFLFDADGVEETGATEREGQERDGLVLALVAPPVLNLCDLTGM